MSHIWHELMKVLHRFGYVHRSSPFAFLSVSTSRGPMSSTEGCQLCPLYMSVNRRADGKKPAPLTDVGNKSSISELPTRDGASYSRREEDA